MKPKFRRKLIRAFLAVIFVPVFSFIASFAILALLFFPRHLIAAPKDNDIKQMTQMLDAHDPITMATYGPTYDDFQSYLKQHKWSLELVSLNGNVIFDSRTPTFQARKESLNNVGMNWADLSSEKIVTEKKNIQPFIQNNRVTGFIVVRPVQSSENTAGGFQINDENSGFFVFSTAVLIAFFSLVATILVEVILISRRIRRPAKEIIEASQKIAKGDLDYAFTTTDQNDEIGDVIRAFETMRLQLKETVEKQVKLEQSRRFMLASVAHDLRTPLTSIKGYVEGLQDGIASKPEDASRYLRVIHEKTSFMERLIRDLFEFAQMHMGNLEFQFQNTSAKEFFDSAADGILGDVEQKGIAFHYLHLNEEEDVQIRIDEFRIRQVIENIVYNAIQFTSAGGTITLEVKKQKNGMLRVTIADTGEGIPPESMPYIFELFYRAEKARTQKRGGSGLGLAIAHHIVQIHGGVIWAESEYQKGTKIRFTLPLSNGAATSME